MDVDIVFSNVGRKAKKLNYEMVKAAIRQIAHKRGEPVNVTQQKVSTAVKLGYSMIGFSVGPYGGQYGKTLKPILLKFILTAAEGSECRWTETAWSH